MELYFMKKNIILITFFSLILSANLFSSEKNSSGYLDAGMSYQFFYEQGYLSTGSENILAFTTMHSLSFDLSSQSYFSEKGKVGFGFAGNFFFPQAIKIKTEYDYSVSLLASDFNLIMGISFLIGPAIRPIHKDNFILSIIPGITLSNIFISADESSFLQLFGLGAEVASNFFLTDIVCLKLGLDYRYFMFSNGNQGFNREDSFTFQPKIAIGLAVK